jgi:hypothetical protein
VRRETRSGLFLFNGRNVAFARTLKLEEVKDPSPGQFPVSRSQVLGKSSDLISKVSFASSATPWDMKYLFVVAMGITGLMAREATPSVGSNARARELIQTLNLSV